MPRTKNKIPSERVSLTGFVSPVRYADVLSWMNSLPYKKRFSVVMNVLNLMVGLLSDASIEDGDEIKNFIFNTDPELVYKKLRDRRINLRLRFKIFARDGYRCVVCGRDPTDGIKLQVDHIKPFSKGGTTEESNLATLCNECNAGKSNQEFLVSYIENQGSI